MISPIDIQELLLLSEELKPLIVQIEESKSNYNQQYPQLEKQMNLSLASKQQIQPQITATNRLSFSPNISGSSQSSLSQSQPIAIGAPPLRSFSSQPQKNNPNRRTENRSHKRSNVTHSDRARAATNSNNVWSRVEQFFLPPPTDQEIEKIFNCRKVPVLKEVSGDSAHWSLRMAPPSCRANGKAIMPPGPPSSSNDMAEFWKKNKAFFQIEKIQKLNSSPLHCLLNAFVELEPEDFEEAKKINMDKKKKNEFARIHSLLPHIDHDDYLQYSFETRLNLELESLELNQPRKSSIDDKPFQKDIVELKNNISNRIIPKLDEYHDQILNNIEEFRKSHILMNEKIDIIEQKINEYSIRKRKRKE